ncbi:MAG: helix-turn-helix domain-containing protein [Cyanobacteria bacterium J06592_8]
MKTSTSTHNLSQFTTATLGTVRHPSNLLMEFLEIWQKTHKVKAYILSWLDSWHKSKGEKGWICASYQQIANAFGYCRDTIYRHLSELIQEGYIYRRNLYKHEKSYPTDTRKMYQINFVKLRQTVCGESLASNRLKSYSYRNEKQTLDAKNQTQLKSNSTLSKIKLTHQPTLEDCASDDGLEDFLKTEDVQVSEDCLQVEVLSEPPENATDSELTPEPFLKISETQKEHEISSEQNPESLGKDLGSTPFENAVQLGNRVDRSLDLKSSCGMQSPTHSAGIEFQHGGEACGQLVGKLNQLIRLPLQPIQLASVEWVIRKYPQNLDGAVAAVERGLKEGWLNNPTGYLIKALKEGIKVDKNVCNAMSRQYWWTWLGQEWGTQKRNSLIERVSDIGEGLKVYFSNGQEYPFEQVKQMSIEEVEALATPNPENPEDQISFEQFQSLKAFIQGVGS